LLLYWPHLCAAICIDAIYDDAYVDPIESKVDLALRVGHWTDTQLIARRVGTMRRFQCASPAYWVGVGVAAEGTAAKWQ